MPLSGFMCPHIASKDNYIACSLLIISQQTHDSARDIRSIRKLVGDIRWLSIQYNYPGRCADWDTAIVHYDPIVDLADSQVTETAEICHFVLS